MTTQRELAIGKAPGLDCPVEALAVLAPKAPQLLAFNLLADHFPVLVVCTGGC